MHHYSRCNNKFEDLKDELAFDFWDEAEAFLEVWADAVEAPAELGVAAVFVGAAGVVTRVQLVAAFGHGGNANVNLTPKRGTRERFIKLHWKSCRLQKQSLSFTGKYQ